MVVLLGTRVYLGLFLLVAALGKVTHTRRFAAGVVDYRVLPEPVARFAGIMLPWIELAAGFGLLLGVAVPVAGLAAALLLSAFTVAVAVNLRRGRSIPCNCYSIAAAKTISWGTVARNAALVALALSVSGLAYTLDRFDRWFVPWPVHSSVVPSPMAALQVLLLVGWCGVIVALIEWSVDIQNRVSGLKHLRPAGRDGISPATGAFAIVTPDGHEAI
jgi:uncharacterized membrane protein YphA (DoxX/SURF4 family)